MAQIGKVVTGKGQAMKPCLQKKSQTFCSGIGSGISSGILTVLLILVPFPGRTEAFRFSWLSAIDLKNSDGFSQAEFIYSHVNANQGLLELKTALCRFRINHSMPYQPGLLKSSWCFPLLETGYKEPISTDQAINDVQILAVTNSENDALSELQEEAVERWASLSMNNPENFTPITLCFFRQYSSEKLGFALESSPEQCHKLQTRSDLNTDTINVTTTNVTTTQSPFSVLSETARSVRDTKPLDWVCANQTSYEMLDHRKTDTNDCRIYKCRQPWSFPYPNANVPYGEDKCTGRCKPEECIWIETSNSIPDGLRRCCQGTTKCYENCLDLITPRIVGVTLGLGIPILCLAGTFIAWLPCTRDKALSCFHQTTVLYRTIRNVVASALESTVAYCLSCPLFCIHMITGTVESGQQDHGTGGHSEISVDPESACGGLNDPPPSYRSVMEGEFDTNSVH